MQIDKQRKIGFAGRDVRNKKAVAQSIVLGRDPLPCSEITGIGNPRDGYHNRVVVLTNTVGYFELKTEFFFCNDRWCGKRSPHGTGRFQRNR